MSPARTLNTSIRFVVTTFTLAVVIPSATAKDKPDVDKAEVGTVRELPVVSVSLAVGSTDREVKRVVYAPPPGWYIRSHRVVTEHRLGTVTYTVSTVPAGWNWTTDERMAASGRVNGTAGVVLPHTLAAGGQVAGSQDTSLVDRQANSSSHHVLVVDVAAKGAGLWKGGGGVDLTVFAEMVYLGK